jgi:hypothetical protein
MYPVANTAATSRMATTLMILGFSTHTTLPPALARR